MLKKTVRVLLLVLSALLLIILVCPFIFKKQINDKIKAEINTQVNAQVNYSGFSISLFKSFPNPTISLDNFVISGHGEFNDDTLLSVQKFTFSVNLRSVLQGNNYKIIALNVVEPAIRLHVNNRGHSNWDIMKAPISFSEQGDVVLTEKRADFSFQVNNFDFEHAHVSFQNDSTQTYMELHEINFHGNQFDNKGAIDLNATTDVKEVTYRANNITYCNKIKVAAQILCSFDTSKNTYYFKDNIIKFNAVQLHLDGTIKSTHEGQLVDLLVQSKDGNFKNLLSLIPAMYDSSFNKLKANGQFYFSASVKGNFNDDHYPAIAMKMKVENGTFQKTGFPVPIKNISLDAGVTKPEGPLDSTVIRVSRLHVETGKDSANGDLLITTPLSNPNMQARVTGNFDLSTLSQFYTSEELKQLNGSIYANVKFKARKSDIDRKNYKLIEASGNVTATDITYQNKSLPVPLKIKETDFSIHPGLISLDKLNAHMGESNFKGTGRFENVISYFTQHGRLIGLLNIKSDTISIRDFINKPVGTGNSKQGAATPRANAKPNEASDAQLTVAINAGVVYYDKFLLEKVNGRIEVDQHGVTITGLTANSLGGSVVVNSHAGNFKDGLADVNFQLKIENMDIQKVYQSLPEAEKSSPWLQHTTGNFSGKLDGKGQIKPDLSMNLNTLYAHGRLEIPDLKIDDMPVLTEIGQLAKVKSLDHLEAKNVYSVFTYKNGKTIIDSTDIKFIKGYRIHFNGVSNSDQTIDADIALDVPVKEFGSVASLAQNLLSGFMKVPQNVQFKFKVTGKNPKPIVKVVGVSTPVD